MRSPRPLLLCGLLWLGAPAPAVADGDWTTPAHLPGVGGAQRIEYPAFSSPTHAAPWMTVGNVGDVNGDGREDLAAGFAPGGPSDEHTVYVTFSSPFASVGAALGLGGFRIATTGFWDGLSSAGDVDGDGLGDVALMHGDHVTVVFGRIDGRAVDTRELGDDGFVITGAGRSTGGGFGGVMLNEGLEPLGDVDGDGVPDLLVASGGGAAVVHGARGLAGSTIDAGAPGPRVSRIVVDPAHALDDPSVGELGDVDGDGRTDVLVGGEERVGTDQVAYGVATPPPGQTLVLPDAIADGKAFSIRTHDGQDGWSGELEQVITLADQNHDGVRDVGLVCGGCGTGGRQLRAVYTPDFGATIDAGSLGAADSRGWSFHSYSAVIDVGDQDGDGVGDVATRSYVYLPRPTREPGDNEPVHRGFYFENGGDIVSSLADVNGDGRREIAVARVDLKRNAPDGEPWAGESATYVVDIYDSAVAPDPGLPTLPELGVDGVLSTTLDLLSGAGGRGDGLPVGATVELAPLGSPAPLASASTGMLGGSRRGVGVGLRGASLVDGAAYRVRAVARNGRGQETVGAWRTFTFTGRRGAQLPATQGGLSILPGRLRLRDGRVAVRVRCGRSTGRCVGRLRLARGKLVLGTGKVSVAARRSATVRVPVSRAARRKLRRLKKVTVVATVPGQALRVKLALRLR